MKRVFILFLLFNFIFITFSKNNTKSTTTTVTLCKRVPICKEMKLKKCLKWVEKLLCKKQNKGNMPNTDDDFEFQDNFDSNDINSSFDDDYDDFFEDDDHEMFEK